MKSMTGYGTGEFSDEKLRVVVDLKAYNNKYLDISINMPQWLSSLEGRIRDLVKDKGIARGRVEFNIRVKELVEDVTLSIDHSFAKNIISSIQDIQALSPSINKNIDLSDVLSFDGVVKTNISRNIDVVWNVLSSEISSVLDEFIFEKDREGIMLKEDIFSSLDLILKDVKELKAYAPRIEAKIKDNFKEKFIDVLGIEIDENRILSEVAVLLVKYDINEELVRLNSHIENFKASSLENPCGKKLDFICQEMNREINTIGSKSPLIEISKIVVNMKNQLEQIREQARNVE